jgi:hypothetical protein
MQKIELTRQTRQTRQTRKANVYRRDYYVVHCHVVGIDLDIYHAMLCTQRKTKIPPHESIHMQLSQLPKKISAAND